MEHKIKYTKDFKDMNTQELLSTKQLILEQIELSIHSRDHIRHEWYTRDLRELNSYLPN